MSSVRRGSARVAPPISKGKTPTRIRGNALPESASPSAKPSNARHTHTATTTSKGGLTTKLSSYPRTDPLRALSTLLKLLSSLPTRIGGCAYKLTPAEHALSLHLVEILDPYVYHGARVLSPQTTHTGTPTGASSSSSSSSSAISSTGTAAGLITLPTEILDAILSHVESQKDLLHTGLICKRLHDVIFPRHFDYRVIRCKVSSLRVWNHLTKHRSLARNVRRLEILDERAQGHTGSAASSARMRIPRHIVGRDTDLETSSDELFMHSKHERFLSTALTKMTGLKEFHWACYHSPISFERVWPTLQSMMVRGKMPLRTLQVCDNLIFGPRVADESGSERETESDKDTKDNSKSPPKSIALVDMEHVSFKSTGHAYGAPKQPELARLAEVLHYCARLKSLDITYIQPRSTLGTNQQILTSPIRSRPIADEFLLYSRWPSLTTLSLSNLRCTTHDALSSFLSVHPNLEVLHLDITINTPAAGTAQLLHLEHNALSNLRELKAPRDIIHTILASPTTTTHPRPLETLKGFKLTGTRSSTDLAFLSTLRASVGSSIKRLELLGWHDMEDVRRLMSAVPNVSHVDIGRRLGPGAYHTPSRTDSKASNNAGGPVTNMVEWAEMLSSFPELVSFHGVRFFYEVSTPGSSTSMPGSTNSTLPTETGVPGSGSGGGGGAVSASYNYLSMTDRSRMRKNDEIASVLAWKCRKLRFVDHWEEHGGKVVALLRTSEESTGVRWEVRRVK